MVSPRLIILRLFARSMKHSNSEVCRVSEDSMGFSSSTGFRPGSCKRSLRRDLPLNTNHLKQISKTNFMEMPSLHNLVLKPDSAVTPGYENSFFLSVRTNNSTSKWPIACKSSVVKQRAFMVRWQLHSHGL